MARDASSVYFGGAADDYERKRAAKPIWDLERAAFDAVVVPRLQAGQHVLDVPAGTGRWLESYAAARVTVTLLDISPDMLAQAEERAKSLGVTVRTQVGDTSTLQQLPAADWLVSTRYFNWIRLDAVERLLRQGVAVGIPRFAVSIRLNDSQSALSKRWGAWLRLRWRNLRVRIGVKKKGVYHRHDAAAFARVVSAAGLAVTAEQVIETIPGVVYKLLILERR